MDHPLDDTPAMARGRALHQAVLEPGTYCPAIYSGRRAGAAWEAFQLEHDLETILNESEAAEIDGMARAILTDPVAMQYLIGPGRNELSIDWYDSESEIFCKGRIDRITDDGVLIDVKSSRDSEARAFGLAAFRYGYHGQMAFYRDGLRNNDVKVVKAINIVVQASPPYEVSVFGYGIDEAIYAGELLYHKLLMELAQCIDSGQWPGRYREEQAIQLPKWAGDELEEEIEQ